MTDATNPSQATAESRPEMAEPLSFAAQLYKLEAENSQDRALSFDGRTYSFGELGRITNRLARHFENLGIGSGDFVTIAESNGVPFVATAIACWKLGAIPQPVSAHLPGRELDAIVELADSQLVVGVDVDGRQSLPMGFEAPANLDDSPLPEAVSPAWKAPTSGGSTGRPKLIVSGDPSIMTEKVAGVGGMIGAGPGQTMVMPGPLYHNGPFLWTFSALLAGGHVSLLPRFNAEETLREIQETQASAIYLVPTMMQRMWKLPDEIKFRYDLTSLRRAIHLAEPCPAWLKEVWIEWIGEENLWELYGVTEGQMFTLISGTDWLSHHGSVGKPISGEAKICGEDGSDLGAGETGEVWIRAVGRDTPTYRYVGAETEIRDGWECFGDIGWMDDEGYLYLADRQKDMILVGGANVYPAEVEAGLNAHPLVESCAVIGLPDEDKGNRIHAIVQVSGPVGEDDSVLVADITEFLAERLVRYKLPRSFEWTDQALRDDAGKVRRGALRQERLDKSGNK